MGVREQYSHYVMTGFVKRVEPVVAGHGDGALLCGADGAEHIDCFAGVSVTNAGHHNEKILAAAMAQAEKLAEITPDKCDMLCARRVGEVIRLHLPGSVCAFIAEPILGEGGIIVRPDDYFRRVKEILDEEGILVIADGVQSGFGRSR